MVMGVKFDTQVHPDEIEPKFASGYRGEGPRLRPKIEVMGLKLEVRHAKTKVTGPRIEARQSRSPAASPVPRLLRLRLLRVWGLGFGVKAASGGGDGRQVRHSGHGHSARPLTKKGRFVRG